MFSHHEVIADHVFPACEYRADHVVASLQYDKLHVVYLQHDHYVFTYYLK